MKRYRVKTAYLDRRVGDEVGCTFDEKFDQVALQAGFLEEVKEQEYTKLDYELAGLMSTQGYMQHYHPDMCLPLAKAALTYLRSRMPHPINFTDDYHSGYNYALREVLREVFGETDCKGGIQ